MRGHTGDLSRRSFLAASALTTTALADGARGEPGRLGKADRCIFLWLGGGMAAIDTFDPKRQGDPKAKKPGTDGKSIPTAVKEVRFSEHLPNVAALADRMTAVRTVSHRTIDEHATAAYFVHTGRMPSDTIRYPSLGSLAVHGQASAGLPPYVVLGTPSVSRDPGFLGPKSGYLHATETGRGPEGFTRPEFVTDARQKRRDALRQALGTDPAAAAQAEAAEAFRRLAGSSFLSLFDLTREPAAVRDAYGADFGQRCLLARRLTQAGVRFVEVSFAMQFVNGAGWDTHNEAQKHQPRFIRSLDQALAALLRDLERNRLLDRTLVAVGTEFGRPPEFDGGGGRGHQSKAFTMILAGGGLRHQGAFGQTDELGKAAVTPAVSVPDFHATVLAALGMDPRREHFDGSRPVPATDGGTPIAALFG